MWLPTIKAPSFPLQGSRLRPPLRATFEASPGPGRRSASLGPRPCVGQNVPHLCSLGCQRKSQPYDGWWNFATWCFWQKKNDCTPGPWNFENKYSRYCIITVPRKPFCDVWWSTGIISSSGTGYGNTVLGYEWNSCCKVWLEIMTSDIKANQPMHAMPAYASKIPCRYIQVSHHWSNGAYIQSIWS